MQPQPGQFVSYFTAPGASPCLALVISVSGTYLNLTTFASFGSIGGATSVPFVGYGSTPPASGAYATPQGAAPNRHRPPLTNVERGAWSVGRITAHAPRPTPHAARRTQAMPRSVQTSVLLWFLLAVGQAAGQAPCTPGACSRGLVSSNLPSVRSRSSFNGGSSNSSPRAAIGQPTSR